VTAASSPSARNRISCASNTLTPNLLVVGLVLPAVLFTLVYFPAMKQSLVLVSPYAKANARKRLYASGVDSLLVMTCWVAYWNAGSMPFAIAALLYLLLRDSIGGQSIGKLLVGQVVVYVDTGERCRVAGSIKRNLVLILPGANVAAILLEARALVLDPQGQRLGDRLARTQVVEGLGARDVVKDLQQWWSNFLAQLTGAAGRPGRGRAVSDR
jgi:uncharacterized RDD family membrane protein YckC